MHVDRGGQQRPLNVDSGRPLSRKIVVIAGRPGERAKSAKAGSASGLWLPLFGSVALDR
jgi:hypothetical protein